MKTINKNDLRKFLMVAMLMALGLILFKYIPMNLYGKNILFDASQHITTTFFLLYVIWFFLPKNKKWKTSFYIFSITALVLVSIQRIIAHAHNPIGLILGVALSLISIFIAEKN